MESRPMKAGELGRYVCVAHGGCTHTGRRGRTIDSDGVWVRSPGPDPLNPGSHLYSSAHRDCYEAWAAREQAPAIDPEIRTAIADVINYNWASEERDFTEHGGEALQPRHIFLKLRRLQRYLETGQ